MDLIGIAFEVIATCNSDCSFCYNVWKENEHYPHGQLPLNDIKRLFDKVLPSVPTQSIYLTGGEPLLRKDLEQIVAYFSAHNLKVSVATNGYLLDEHRAKSLVAAGVRQFEITLLSTDEDLHNRLSGNPDSYRRACQAVLNVKKLKQHVFLGFTATKDNIHDAGSVMDLCFALCADGLSFYRFVPTGKGLHNQEQLMPSLGQINDALEILDDKSGQYKLDVYMGIPICSGHLRRRLRHIKMTNCQAGLTKFTIDYLGNLRLCEQNPDILGSLFEDNFLSLVLSKEVRQFRTMAKKAHGDCPLLFRKEKLLASPST